LFNKITNMPKDTDLKKPKMDKPQSMMSAPGQIETEKLIEQPSASEYKGAYRNRKDGYLYKHAIQDHPMGKTHKAIVERQEGPDGTLIHSGLFWEGTDEEFRNTFDRE